MKSTLKQYSVLLGFIVRLYRELDKSLLVFLQPSDNIGDLQTENFRLALEKTIELMAQIEQEIMRNKMMGVLKGSGTLSLIDVCSTVITPQNCSHSLDEWCFAHNFLMQAVYSGVIPLSCDFNCNNLHWHQVLYTHSSKLTIGEKDINYLLSLFREAEAAGVMTKEQPPSLSKSLVFVRTLLRIPTTFPVPFTNYFYVKL